MTRRTTVERRAYFGDTDSGGVVHHAAYVHWFEHARTEWIHERGGCLEDWIRAGVVFVVARMEVRYVSPVRLDDVVRVSAELERLRGSVAVFAQEASLGGKTMCAARMTLVCVDLDSGRPVPVPDELRMHLE